MIYSESSYAGPDITGARYPAFHFQHIARWKEENRKERIREAMRKAAR